MGTMAEGGVEEVITPRVATGGLLLGYICSE